MKITPLEIRQKTFERTLRGYDKDEVNAFLLSLSQEWERTVDEAKEWRIKLEATEKEVAKLREVESSLFKTLKTAETTGANVIDQAQKSAELLLRESQLKCEALLNEAKAKAKNTIEEAEITTRQMVEEMEDRLKALTEQYKELELHRDNLLADMKRMAGETIDRVERIKSGGRDFSPEQLMATAKRETRKVLYPNEFDNGSRKMVSQETVMVETKVAFAEEQKFQRSFFDDIQ
ncbi:MAG: DivIVA domain-containing protein [Bacteroidota bacterium]